MGHIRNYKYYVERNGVKIVVWSSYPSGHYEMQAEDGLTTGCVSADCGEVSVEVNGGFALKTTSDSLLEGLKTALDRMSEIETERFVQSHRERGAPPFIRRFDAAEAEEWLKNELDELVKRGEEDRRAAMNAVAVANRDDFDDDFGDVLDQEIEDMLDLRAAADGDEDGEEMDQWVEDRLDEIESVAARKRNR